MFRFAVIAIVVIARACLAYDPWLRAVLELAVWCAIALVFAALAVFPKNWIIQGVMIALLGFFLIFSVPAPSVSLGLEIHSTTADKLEIVIRHREKDRVKQLHIDSGKSERFVYFQGDGPNSNMVPVTIRVTRSSVGLSKSIDMELPLSHRPERLVIDEDWFRKK